MRVTLLVILSGLLVTAALLAANWRLTAEEKLSSEGPVVVLTNLPATYCPSDAQISHTSALGTIIKTGVVNCRELPLGRLGLSDSEVVYIKLPKALAFAVNYSQAVDRYVVGVRVGDATGDNVIDGDDEQLITDAMFGSAPGADVDLNRSVTAEDLALARINTGVGQSPPEGGRWE